MPIKPEKPQKGNQRRKGRGQVPSRQSVSPDEVISEINHQSTALQKIVSRFLDTTADEDKPVKREEKKR